MTKTIIEQKDVELMEEMVKDTKRRIVDYIKGKYCLELTNIDDLVKTIVRNVMVVTADNYNQRDGNMMKAAEKWFLLHGINGEFHEHSIYGFSKMMDANNYTVIIPKHKVLTKLKYIIAIKLFRNIAKFKKVNKYVSRKKRVSGLLKMI